MVGLLGYFSRYGFEIEQYRADEAEPTHPFYGERITLRADRAKALAGVRSFFTRAGLSYYALGSHEQGGDLTFADAQGLLAVFFHTTPMRKSHDLDRIVICATRMRIDPQHERASADRKREQNDFRPL